MLNVQINKKVLLRERKRHTDRGVASTRYVTLVGGYPQPGAVPLLAGYLLLGGTPARGYPCWGGTPTWEGSIPPSRPGKGVPPVSWMG